MSNPVGRPTDYNPEYDKQAYKLALMGATDGELADFFETSEVTLNAWKKQFPEFLKSIKEGKKIADAEIATKLYERAYGAEWIEERAFKLKDQTASGVFTERIEVVPVICKAPPDTQAISLWLRNRQSGKWRDKQEIDHGGQIDNPITAILRTVIDPASNTNA
jgi:hypothetical protein